MQLKDILLRVRTQIEDGSYREGLCVIYNIVDRSYRAKLCIDHNTLNLAQALEYRDLLNSVIATKHRYPIPSGNSSVPKSTAYYNYRTNTPLEGFDMEAYKARRLKILDKVIELCN